MGATPSTSKNVEEVAAPRSRSGSPLERATLNVPDRYAAIDSIVVDRRCQSAKVAGATAPRVRSRRSTSFKSTMRSASRNGSPCSITPLTMLNMAVLAPMPTASVKMTMKVKPGVLSSTRAACRRS